MSNRVLSVENLSVDIPLADGVLHAVDNVTLHVDRGETLCICLLYTSDAADDP